MSKRQEQELKEVKENLGEIKEIMRGSGDPEQMVKKLDDKLDKNDNVVSNDILKQLENQMKEQIRVEVERQSKNNQ